MGVCLVLQAAKRLFNFALYVYVIMCVGVWAGRLSPLPPPGGREHFRVGERYFWSISYNIVNIIQKCIIVYSRPVAHY